MTCGPQFGIPPGWGGASLPENRVVARSRAPQKRWTGLDLPTKRDRNTSSTRSVSTSIRQNVVTATPS